MGELDAVHAGHVHVEDRQVELVAALDRRERLGRRRDGLAAEPPRVGLQVEDAPVDRVVVDDEHALAGQLARHARRGGTRAARRPARRRS